MGAGAGASSGACSIVSTPLLSGMGAPAEAAARRFCWVGCGSGADGGAATATDAAGFAGCAEPLCWGAATPCARSCFTWKESS